MSSWPSAKTRRVFAALKRIGWRHDRTVGSHRIMKREGCGLARFLRLYRSGAGDYTRDRHQWLEGATIQEITAEVERRDNPAA